MNFKKLSKIGIGLIVVVGVVLLANIAYNIVYSGTEKDKKSEWSGTTSQVGSSEEDADECSSKEDTKDEKENKVVDESQKSTFWTPSYIYNKDTYNIDDIDSYYKGNDLEGLKDVIRAIQETYTDVFDMLEKIPESEVIRLRDEGTCDRVSSAIESKINYDGRKAMGADMISVYPGLSIIGFAGDMVEIMGYDVNGGMESKEIVVMDFTGTEFLGEETDVLDHKVGETEGFTIYTNYSIQIKVGDYNVIYARGF